MSVIVVQAEAAQEVLAARPEQAGAAMATVADTARSALTELRRMMGVLRSDATTAPSPTSRRSTSWPTSCAGPACRSRCAARTRCRPSTRSSASTTYRVVQEALTNVLRHAPDATRADVDVAVDDHVLLVTVSDDGPPVAAPGSTGLGLVGMRERVGVLGRHARRRAQRGRGVPGAGPTSARPVTAGMACHPCGWSWPTTRSSCAAASR